MLHQTIPVAKQTKEKIIMKKKKNVEYVSTGVFHSRSRRNGSV